MIAELERRTREEFADSEDATHLDYVVRWVASGGTVIGLLAAMSDVGDVKRAMLMDYLEKQYGAEVTRRMTEARLEGAHAMVEDGAEIIEGARADRDSIALAKLRADSKNFIAGRWNRQAYGEPKQSVALQFNIGTAFLEALRRRAEDARLSSARSRAFVSQANDLAVEASSSDAIAGAIAPVVDEVSYEIIES